MAENQGNLTNTYPIPTDGNQSQKVLFPDGITSLAEDYAQQEQMREFEDLVRFNGIVKTPGIVSLNSSELITVSPYTGRKLFPYTTDNGLVITAGVGFTRNGALINIAQSISIPSASYNLIPNYTTDLTNKRVFLVLRKITYDVFKRSHPITGEQQDTRRYIVSDKSCVEFLVINDDENYVGNIAYYDKDVVILGRITNIASPAITFDYTRILGGRQLVRVTETPTAEVGGFTMEGHINMQNLWEVLNLPLLGSNYWLNNGSVNNRDFTKLFTQTNYKLGLLRDIKFVDKGSNTYAFSLLNPSALAKIKIFPAIAPPKAIEIKNTTSVYELNIPDNHICYLKLSDSASGWYEGNGLTVPAEEQEVTLDNMGSTNYQLLTANYSTVASYNNADRLRMYPICWHYTNGTDRKLVFANGLILNVGEEINSKGKYSGYVDTDGDNMFGDLSIIKTDGKYIIKKNTASFVGQTKSGLFWKNNLSGSSERIIGACYRVDNMADTIDGYGELGLINGDIIIETNDNTGNNAEYFVFKTDGRLQVFASPVDINDVVTLGYAISPETGFVRRAGDSMTGDLQFLNGGQPVVVHPNPGMTLFVNNDATSSYQTFSIKNQSNKLIGRIIRFSSSTTPGYTNMQEGDLLFETWDNENNSFSKSEMILSSVNKELYLPYDLTVGQDADIGRDLDVGRNLVVEGIVTEDLEIGVITDTTAKALISNGYIKVRRNTGGTIPYPLDSLLETGNTFNIYVDVDGVTNAPQIYANSLVSNVNTKEVLINKTISVNRVGDGTQFLTDGTPINPISFGSVLIPKSKSYMVVLNLPIRPLAGNIEITMEIKKSIAGGASTVKQTFYKQTVGTKKDHIQYTAIQTYEATVNQSEEISIWGKTDTSSVELIENLGTLDVVVLS